MPTAKDPRVTVRIDVEDHARLVKAARRAKMGLGPFIVQQAVTHTAQQALRQDVPPDERPVVAKLLNLPGPGVAHEPEPRGIVELDQWLSREHQVPVAVARRWLARGHVRLGDRAWKSDRIPAERLGEVTVDR